jgi:hypothetical protein
MAIRGAIPIGHEGVFLHGCFVVGEVEPVRDFDRSTKETAVQAVDKDTGLPVWQVDVVDADPEAREKTVRVKILATVQPVPPAEAPGVPFRPVEFDDLTAMPYVATTATGRARLAWSFKATAMHSPTASPITATAERKAG